MKRTYTKPEILFEDFSLNTSISAGCEYRDANSTEGVCGYPDRDGNMIFVTGVTGCKYHQPDVDDTLCYHVPNEFNNIFNS